MPPIRSKDIAALSDQDENGFKHARVTKRIPRKSSITAKNAISNAYEQFPDNGCWDVGILNDTRSTSISDCNSSLTTLVDSDEDVTVSASKPTKTAKTKVAPASGNFTEPIVISGVTLRPTVAFKTFWWYAAERKAIDDKRRAGEPAPWTEDKTLQNYFFCNTFRVLDKVCQYLIKEVIEKGPQKDEEVVFRVILFNLFTKIETWELLVKHLGPLTWKTYDRDQYEAVLSSAVDRGMTLYTGAFIKPAPKFDFDTNYMNHLCFMETLMHHDVTSICKNAVHLADVFEWLISFPSLGEFSTYQLMLSLSYTKMLNFHRNDFVVTGPGSLSGLGKIFGKSFLEGQRRKPNLAEEIMRFLAEHQQHYFNLGGFAFSGLGPKKLLMDLADIEHTLCEVDKYCRAAHPNLKGKRTNLHRTFQSSTLKPYPQAVFPKAWNHPARRKPRVRKDTNLVIEKRYVIERLLEQRQGAEGVEYRVRWKGYTAQDDTWENEEHLEWDAPDALAEYKARQKL